MYTRLPLLRDLLADDGTLWLHCDHRQAHHLRCLLEEVFGAENYLNTITWRSQDARGAKVTPSISPTAPTPSTSLPRTASARPTWHAPETAAGPERSEASAEFMARRTRLLPHLRPRHLQLCEPASGCTPPGGLYAPYGGEVVLDEENQRVSASTAATSASSITSCDLATDRYAVERGVDNLWDDIPGLGTTPSEDLGYPTQKTEALLRRVIAAGHAARRLGARPLLGSGTTAGRGAADGPALDRLRRGLRRGPDHAAACAAHAWRCNGPGFACYRMVDRNVGPQAGALAAQARVVGADGTTGGDYAEVTVEAYQPEPASFAGRNAPAWAVGERVAGLGRSDRDRPGLRRRQCFRAAA